MLGAGVFRLRLDDPQRVLQRLVARRRAIDLLRPQQFNADGTVELQGRRFLAGIFSGNGLPKAGGGAHLVRPSPVTASAIATKPSSIVLSYKALCCSVSNLV